MAKRVKKIAAKKRKKKELPRKFQDTGCPRIIYILFFFVILILAISVYQYQKSNGVEVTIIPPPTVDMPAVKVIEEPVAPIEPPLEEEPTELVEEEPTPVEEKPVTKKEYTVILKGRAFEPAELIIPWDSTVIFKNEDDLPHTILGRTRPYDFKRSIHLYPMKPGEESEFHFQRTGNYEIYSGTIASIKMYITVK